MSAFVVFSVFGRAIYQDSYPPAGGHQFDPAPRYEKADTQVSAFVVFGGFERVFIRIHIRQLADGSSILPT
ncbi:hypothetical protein [Sphingobacterium spiritivorum]|uniref:hypothetical protein n=1 Tax=Sphingobacterium spiritivorum TaxID=258 RepID=UPI00191962E0|nr:hypothetical protein [Sphingobacterium spiritivorum]QQT26795.1 hypothetical protein I6J02_02725 [Sphingobacterium spiritivorum]